VGLFRRVRREICHQAVAGVLLDLPAVVLNNFYNLREEKCQNAKKAFLLHFAFGTPLAESTDVEKQDGRLYASTDADNEVSVFGQDATIRYGHFSARDRGAYRLNPVPLLVEVGL
jgi:hypothetical protein